MNVFDFNNKITLINKNIQIHRTIIELLPSMLNKRWIKQASMYAYMHKKSQTAFVPLINKVEQLLCNVRHVFL